MHTPFYDPLKTYEENFKQGPFGALADGSVFENKGEPEFEYLGRKIYFPFGIPAGPIINSRFMQAALEKGFDVGVYKTVRTRAKKTNEWPNILPVNIEGDLTMEKAKKGLVVKKDFTQPLAITNSFGNPSYAVEFWQEDVAKAAAWANKGKGQMVCGMIE